MKLVFVYNADSGMFNTITDIAHKIISPDTYSCSLCALTHGHFKIRDSWVSFLQDLDIECDFLHRDDLLKKYKVKDAALPVIYKNTNGKLDVFINKENIEKFNSVEELIEYINIKLAETI